MALPYYLCINISGAIYSGVPQIEEAPYVSEDNPFLQRPKSVSFMNPSAHITIFSGFKLMLQMIIKVYSL